MVSPKLIVVKRWSWKQFTVLTLAILILLGVFSVSGYLLGIRDAIALNIENTQLKEKVSSLTHNLDENKSQLVMQKQISKVDRAANFHAGNSMDSQLRQIRELERELSFFRSIMAPEESIKGLQISRFNWQQQQNSVDWQLSLSQAGSQGRALSGFVKLDLVVMRGDEKLNIPLTDEKQSDRFNYRFKYFQHLTGTFVIADDMIPILINVVAKPAISGQPSIEKQFPWQSDEEKLAHVE